MKGRNFMKNYGVVLKRLRVERNIPIKRAALLINKSVGWLSEVENSKGFAKIKEDEFNRIVLAYGADIDPQKFSGWTTLEAKESKKPKSDSFKLDGAILKYLRTKAKLSLSEASLKLGCQVGYLCDIENGRKPVSVKTRNRILELYNYSPSSFKNFSSEDKRSKNVPAIYRLNIVVNHLNEADRNEVLNFALQKINFQKGA